MIFIKFKIVVLILIVFVSGCSEESAQNSDKIENVILSVSGGMVNAPILIAHNNGYFEEEGLNVEFKNFGSGKLAFQNMLDGDSDISTVAPIPLIISSFEREDFKVVAKFVSSVDNEKIIAHKDRVSKISDLKGKKIGVTKGTSSEFLLDIYLKNNGVLVSDVEILDIAPSDLLDAISFGSVDAIVIWEPTATKISQNLGENSFKFPNNPEVYRATFNIVVNDKLIDERPQIITKFLKSIERANHFMSKNKEESQDILSEILGFDKEIVIILWDKFDYELLLGQDTIINFEDQSNWILENNLVSGKEIPNYLNYIYYNALEEINPDKVKLIK